MSGATLVLLGAGGPKRKPTEHQVGLQKITSEGASVIERLISSAEGHVSRIDFVGGYEIDKVILQFPQMTYHFNDSWKDTGSVVSLAIALESVSNNSGMLVCYDDIIVSPLVVSQLVCNDRAALSIGVVPHNVEFNVDTPETISYGKDVWEFSGIFYVPPRHVQMFKKMVLEEAEKCSRSHLSAVLARWVLVTDESCFDLLNVDGQWAHVENTSSVSKLLLGTKAKTLSRLRDKVNLSEVLPLVYFTRGQWVGNKDGCLEKVMSELSDGFLVVRSSAQNEDGFEEVNAGVFESILNVNNEIFEITSSINCVFESYQSNSFDDEVLIQPMLRSVAVSGVVFTRTLGSGAPYYVVSFSEGEDTTVITSGAKSDEKLWKFFKSSTHDFSGAAPERVQAIVAAAREIERLANYDALDIEFAIDTNDVIYTLQVRPVFIRQGYRDRTTDASIEDALESIERYVTDEFTPKGILGGKAIWSVMSDWNPAEIIGVRPHPFSLDLYRHIITDEIWSKQRAEVGYRNLGSYSLIRSFSGLAYVDVRASLNSLVPLDLSEEIAERVITYALSKLEANPELHDKIEFSLLPTCLDFNFERWRTEYLTYGVLSEESVELYRLALRKVTKNVIERAPQDLLASEKLDKRFRQNDWTSLSYADQFENMLSTCRVSGTLPFAHLARAGFVAASLLQSLVDENLITTQRKSELLSSIKTISTKISEDAWLVRQQFKTRDEFCEDYGHLRPGTYDISSPSYSERSDVYIDPLINTAKPVDYPKFEWTETEHSKLEGSFILAELGLTLDELYDFFETAIAGREYSKYVFTKLLSGAIDTASILLDQLLIPDSNKPFVSLNDLLDLRVEVTGRKHSTGKILARSEERRTFYELSSQVELPPMICNKSDLYCFGLPGSKANYVTTESCEGTLVCLSDNQGLPDDLCGKIIAIPSADPGYDYLFSLGIKGLVTAYGGPNSHMAIRCAEFNIPAVMGVGDGMFAKLETGLSVEINCSKSSFSFHKVQSQ